MELMAAGAALGVLLGLVVGVALISHIDGKYITHLRERLTIAEDRLYHAWRDADQGLVVPTRDAVIEATKPPERPATAKAVELHRVLESIISEWDAPESQMAVRGAFEDLARDGFSAQAIVEKYLKGEIEGINPQGPPV